MVLHEAVRLAYEGRMTQDEVAAALPDTDQSTISKWSTGKLVPTIEQVAALEAAAGRPRGFVFRAAGYVEDPASCEDCIQSDPRLDDIPRAILLVAYDGALEQSKRSRTAPKKRRS